MAKTNLNVVARGRKSPPPPGETPEARFIRLAEQRMKRVLKCLDSIGKLSGSRYRSSPAQIAAMASAIDKALTKAFDQLDRKNTAKTTDFAFLTWQK